MNPTGEQTETSTTGKGKGSSTKKWVFVVIGVIFIIFIVVFPILWWYLHRQNQQSSTGSSQNGTSSSSTGSSQNGTSSSSTGSSQNGTSSTTCPTSSNFTGDITYFDLYSNKIPTYTNVPDLATCLGYCNDTVNNPNCQWVTYSPSSKDCYLKIAVPVLGINSGFQITGNPSGSTCPAYSKLPANYNIPGFDMKDSSGNALATSSGITSEQDCQNYCTKTQGCQFYSYISANNMCYPKQSAKTNDLITGFKIN
jgi:hypothetical protein